MSTAEVAARLFAVEQLLNAIVVKLSTDTALQPSVPPNEKLKRYDAEAAS